MKRISPEDKKLWLGGVVAVGLALAACGDLITLLPSVPTELSPTRAPVSPAEALPDRRPGVPTETPRVVNSPRSSSPTLGNPMQPATTTLSPAAEPAAVDDEVMPGTEAFVAVIQGDLASQLGMNVGQVVVVSVELVEWGDTSLGCPQPGYMYAQVITPGYQVVLEAAGQAFTYHADTKSTFVLCEQKGEGE